MKKKKIEKKSFYQRRQFRLNNENYEWLLRIKKGTWNHTFNLIKQKYGAIEFQKLPNKKAREENSL